MFNMDKINYESTTHYTRVDFARFMLSTLIGQRENKDHSPWKSVRRCPTMTLYRDYLNGVTDSFEDDMVERDYHGFCEDGIGNNYSHFDEDQDEYKFI